MSGAKEQRLKRQLGMSYSPHTHVLSPDGGGVDYQLNICFNGLG